MKRSIRFKDVAAEHVWSLIGVAAATGCFWLLRQRLGLDKGQASVLYLPVVIACAVRGGFAPAITAALMSFFCWDFFFIPPYTTFEIDDIKDWLSLFVFLIAAITTAKLASSAREQANAARRRENNINTLYRASEAVSQLIEADRLLPELAFQIEQTTQSSQCVIFIASDAETDMKDAWTSDGLKNASNFSKQTAIAQAAYNFDQDIGFGAASDLWNKALHAIGIGVAEDRHGSEAFVVLRAQGKRMGVLYVGQKTSLDQFSEMDERLVRTLANHAAVVLARQSLAAKAAQAEALREADVLKDRILSLASHEMRTPLAAIKASATGLLQSKEKYGREGSRDALRSIASEVDRLSNLIGNMLDLSRLEAGAWAPSKEWCDIEEIISTALDRMLEEDGARVEVTISPSIPLIYADYVQLAIVLTNLLSNAVKYGRDHAPILLNVAAAELIDGQPTITVSVRDFGAGFASGEETALFERFYRSQRHRASAIHGAGLGLSLCQAIIEAHEGKIWARNAAAPDESGAIFAFSLPVNEYESTKFQQTDIDR